MYNCKRILVFLALIGAFCCRAQHYQFSQFYAAPMYLNPAFTGAGVCGRMTLNYRSQWTGIPGAFTSYQASFDHFFRKIKSGMGVQLFKDVAGPGSLTTTQVNFMYSYETRLNKKLMGRGGLSLGTVQRNVSFTSLLFGDQIENGDAVRTAENIAAAGATYLDVGAGALVYSKEFWVGVASSHMNKPDQSLLNNVSPLPSEFRLHAGYKYVIEEYESSKAVENHHVTIAANFKHQGKFNQVDIGVYYNKNYFVAGCWYRGIPLHKKDASYENNDAVIFLLGVAIQRFKVGYSYDLTVSSLTNASSKGSNELSMTYQFCKGKARGGRKKKNVLISCPKF
jgi:type IX secretion system PorP/SprF family membrane protein